MSAPCYYCELEDDACKSCIHSNEYVDPSAKVAEQEKALREAREALVPYMKLVDGTDVKKPSCSGV